MLTAGAVCQCGQHLRRPCGPQLTASCDTFFVVLSKTPSLFGTTIDKLVMKACIDIIYNKAKPKSKRILRARRFFSTADFVMQFKAHVFGIIEATFLHSTMQRHPLWTKQKRLSEFVLSHLDLNEKDGFLYYGLAPLVLRRDIGMLGVLYKCAHNTAHPELCELFRRAPLEGLPRHATRRSSRQHGLQLEVFADGDQRMAFSTSLFGLVKVWNALPAQAVISDSVCSFQSCLTRYSRTACSHKIARWKHLFSPPTVHLHIFKL